MNAKTIKTIRETGREQVYEWLAGKDDDEIVGVQGISQKCPYRNCLLELHGIDVLVGPRHICSYPDFEGPHTIPTTPFQTALIVSVDNYELGTHMPLHITAGVLREILDHLTPDEVWRLYKKYGGE